MATLLMGARLDRSNADMQETGQVHSDDSRLLHQMGEGQSLGNDHYC